MERKGGGGEGIEIRLMNKVLQKVTSWHPIYLAFLIRLE